MALSKEEREIIKNKLPHGSQSLIAKSIGCSRITVCFYFSGRNNNIQIETKAVEMYCQVIKREKEIKKAIEDAQM